MWILVLILCISAVAQSAWPGHSQPLQTWQRKRQGVPLAAGTCSLSECLEESRAHGKREDFKYSSERWCSSAQVLPLF